MSRTPPRLWRKLGASAPVARCYTEHAGDLLDDRLVSLTMTRGDGNPAGFVTASADVRVKGTLPAVTASSSDLRVVLTDHALERLTALTGRDISHLRYRYAGRTAGQTVTDDGDHDRARTTTQLSSASWSTRVKDARRGGTFTTDAYNVRDLYQSVYERSWSAGAAAGNIPMTFVDLSSGLYGRRFTPEDGPVIDVTAGDAWGKYAADLGILIRTTRTGAIEVLSSDALDDRRTRWASYAPHVVHRSHVLAPIEWQQRITTPGTLRYSIKRDDGTTVATSISIGTDPASAAWPLEDLDLTDLIVVNEDTLAAAMTARVSRSALEQFSLTSVTVDLLRLLTGSPAHRDIAAQLLAMEIGDPVPISNDWPDAVDGVYHAVTLRERMTRTAWELEVELLPTTHVTGRPSPSVAGQTWDTAYRRDAVWDDAPSITRWETAP